MRDPPIAAILGTMSRRAWILWLMLALLPLRGWAAGSMSAEMIAHAMPAGQTQSQTQAHAMPCHDAADGLTPDDTSSHSCCVSCDICHAATGSAPDAAMPAGPAPHAVAAPSAGRDTGRAWAGGLERPPRLLSL
jgi:hypothetical protein